MLYKVALTFESVDESWRAIIQRKAIEQYFSLVLFIMLYKVDLTFESVDESWSDESYWAVISFVAVYFSVQGGSNFSVCVWNHKDDHSNESYNVCLFYYIYKFLCFNCQYIEQLLL